jgi:dimethylhistidine N-methyltransferase
MRIITESSEAGSITLYDLEPAPERLCEEVARCLAAPQRSIPPKYFYDERGARLFERITQLEAYYPTATEVSILDRHAVAIAERIGPHVRLVEFGSGSGEKTWILLRHLRDPTSYVPVDIARTQLVAFSLAVAEALPTLQVRPVCADYTRPFELPPPDDGAVRTVAFFPGSTIGNLEPGAAEAFLAQVRRMVGEGGGLLIGVDLVKDPAVIELAYNDPEGVTAAFNMNLLARINRECGGDFDLGRFHHYAFFDPDESRVEMRLVSEGPQTVTLAAAASQGEPPMIHFGAGQYITTEYSYKYRPGHFVEVAERAGWRVSETWVDEREWFEVALLE